MAKRTTIAVTMAAVAVCFVILFVSVCGVGVLHHDCVDGSCGICCQFGVNEKLLQSVTLTLCGICAMVSCLVVHVFVSKYHGAVCHTPVMMKVKLLN
ncbi:MAG: hypothetical protein IJY08_01160 [Clostridia bacterium]|nr:hypothetical protein [Clostridia bacterium]